MWSVIRLVGGASIAGLLGVAIAMLSIGLAIVALDDNKQVTILALIPFGIAAFFGVLFLERWIYLARYAAETSNKITAVMGHVRDGLSLRDDLLNKVIEIDTEKKKALVQWSESVERWIEEEEPDYFSDFKTAVPGIVGGVTSLNLGRQSSFYVHIIDAQLGALRELMADLRTRR